MSGLNDVLNIATSGLLTAQSQLRVTSDNVSNVSTAGYIRKVADQQAKVSGTGEGAGVDIGQFRLAADRFLQAAGLQASAASAGAQTAASTLDQAQALFGDPTGSSSVLGGLDTVFSSFAALSSDASAAARIAPLGQLQGFLGQVQGVGAGVTQLGHDADEQLSDQVSQANSLLTQIDGLNAQISRGSVAGGDVTGAQNQQSTLIDQLTQLAGVRVQATSLGGVTVRTQDGTLLVGPGSKPAVLGYDPDGPTGVLSISADGAAALPTGPGFTSGSLAALLKLRNVDLPAVGDQVASLADGVAGALNAAHNAHSAAPAPATLTGRATALSPQEAFGGFTGGRTAVAVTDANGTVTQRVDVDWGAGTLSVNGGAATAFTPATFVSSLNTALSPAGSAAYSASGALTLSAASGGITVADDPSAPTSRAGQTFSGFLGLNDLVGSGSASGASSAYATGLTAADASGFTGDLTLRITGPNGERVLDRKIAAPAAPATVGDLVSALNNPTSGLGVYGSFALDPAGRLAFTPQAGTGETLSVVSDTTTRGAGGPSISSLFGLGQATRANAVSGLAVRPDIASDPSKLALASFTWSAGAGAAALSSADVSGADALGQAGKTAVTFLASGGLPGGAIAVSDYAAKVGADVARRASDAADVQTSAAATAGAASDRRSSVEGVNLDEELVNLTTYQQAYSASARLVSTVRDMFDTLLSLVPA